MAAPTRNLSGPAVAGVAPRMSVLPTRPSMGTGGGRGPLRGVALPFALVHCAPVAPMVQLRPFRPARGVDAVWSSMAWRYSAGRRGWQIYPSGRNR